MTNRRLLFAALPLLVPALLVAETCTTQSRLSPTDRNAIAQAAQTIALAAQSNDSAKLRSASDSDIQKSFGELQYLVAVTAPKLAGGTPAVEQIYLLDATNLKPNADGSMPEAQFFCSLNTSSLEAQFVIPSLPPGRYAFAMVDVPSRPAPWRLSMLLLNQNGQWLLAGFYPKQTTLAGHDGLWYWTQARQYANQKQPWNAWLFYQEAMDLLQPAGFVQSTHLDKLHSEEAAATPPALSGGISAQTPLVIRSSTTLNQHPAQPAATAKAAANPLPDLRFTGLSLAEPVAGSAAPVLHADLEADPLSDPAAARQRNLDAARTLLNTYPELRKAFTDISITTTSADQPPLTTATPVQDLH